MLLTNMNNLSAGYKYIIGFLGLLLILLFIFKYYSESKSNLPSTYFIYTNTELKPLAGLSSTTVVSLNSLQRWDQTAFNLVKDNKLGDAYAARIYAALYVAQRDATFLSEKIKHRPIGSLDPISSKVLCLFFPGNCLDLQKFNVTDSYSEALANIVFSKINAKIALDNNAKPYPEKKAAQYWAGTRPYFAQEVGSWNPWFLTQGSEFRVPPPPDYNSSEWNKQLNAVKNALADISPLQIRSVAVWAGNPGTVTPPGIWLDIVNDYLWSHSISLNKILMVRSVLAMGIEDSLIAVYDSKYTYWVKRPNMRDPTILTIMPTPNHPSYPAGHSALSSTADVILDFYLPDSKKYWDAEADQASMGRIWGGIHFPIDAEQGFSLGHKVGEAAIHAASSQYHD